MFQAADLWSLGIIIYTFIVGRLPFWAPGVIELAQKIQTEPYTPLPADLKLPKDFCSMLEQLMCKDPNQRYTLGNLARNNWITRGGREPLVLTTTKEQDDGMQATMTSAVRASVRADSSSILRTARKISIVARNVGS